MPDRRYAHSQPGSILSDDDVARRQPRACADKNLCLASPPFGYRDARVQRNVKLAIGLCRLRRRCRIEHRSACPRQGHPEVARTIPLGWPQLRIDERHALMAGVAEVDEPLAVDPLGHLFQELIRRLLFSIRSSYAERMAAILRWIGRGGRSNRDVVEASSVRHAAPWSLSLTLVAALGRRPTRTGNRRTCDPAARRQGR